jgi:RNA polymerase sigma factor (sigma-70 family)
MERASEQIATKLLVLRTQAGDREAFGWLVDLWQERLWRHARALTDSDEEAWDVVQETWTGVVKGIARLDDAATFPKWVFCILARKAADLTRRRRSERKTRAELPTEGDEPAGRFESERAADLREAVKRLGAQDRQLLALHYAEGFTTAEIGEILGVPQGTVKSRLYSVRQELKKWMEEKDG